MERDEVVDILQEYGAHMILVMRNEVALAKQYFIHRKNVYVGRMEMFIISNL